MFPLLAKLNRPVVAILAVGAIAGVLRFNHLGYPERRIFDEYYYPKSACIFLGYSNERCDINSADERLWRDQQNDTGAWVHPPLGKWMIAVGELGFGTESFGWRVSSAVTGTATVMLLAFMVHLLFASTIWTFTGGLLLAVENLHFVQSRTAMLDVFVTFWIVLGFAFLLLDRRWIEHRTPEPDAPARERAAGSVDDPTPPSEQRLRRGPPAPLWRPWRFAAGAAFGAGVATKWSGLTAIAVAVVLSFIWEVSRRHRAGVRHPVADAIPAEGFGLVLAFVIVSSAVYLASYAGWFAHFGFDPGQWMALQGNIFEYHRNLSTIDPATGEPIHPYLAQAWKWILLWRPIAYYADFGEGVRQVIYANGNPAIFWGSILAVPYAAFAWWSKRDWRAGFVVVTVAGLYLPWMLVQRPQFVFYATPITPFFVLACVYALKELSEVRYEALHAAGNAARAVRPYLPIAVAFVVAAVGVFVWFWPTLTGGPLSDEDWLLRAWFPTWT
ncbi:MAG: phospholipid carrier-dependent glycosyltransferase [Actinomycetota bacterium]